MSKGYLEALERVGNILEHHYPVRDFNIIKQALQRLNAIENAKPSKAIECLERIDEEYSTIDNEDFETCFNVIKKSLLKSQDLEKENARYKRVLGILFKKQVDLGWLWYCIHECVNSLNEYNKKMPIEKFRLTQEEFELLKEMLK